MRELTTSIFKEKHLAQFAAFAVESLSDGVFLIARDASIVYVNTAACKQLGYSEDELLNLNIMDINPGLTQEIWDSVWGVTVSDKIQTIETTHLTKDGLIVPVEVIANYIEIEGEQYSCTFTRDISKRKEMEARIRQSEKMEAIGFLAGGVAHDFNNQLCGILGYTDLLQLELSDASFKVTNYLDGIKVATQRAAGLTSQLLAFARQGKYLSVSVNVHKLILETIEILARSINKNIKIITHLEAGNSYTLGDPSQLESVLLNLGINARDAMPEGGELLFETGIVDVDGDFTRNNIFKLEQGKYIRICVSDTGLGMTEDVRKRIFEPFFTTKEYGKGTGMGLASVYGTVKNHRGAVEVTSIPGKGTEMILFLPCISCPEVEEEIKLPIADALPAIKANILLVDDERYLLKAVGAMLERLGCQVTTVDNGIDAIRIYREQYAAFDAVILDVIMPEMGGKTTFMKMKEINPNIVTIIDSGYSLTSDVQEMLDAGAQGLIKKPFLIYELAEMLNRVLGKGVID
ncbi:MAG: response regulator [Deltaproteobacteria bacterium]|nr:response regulator [Deltaproteobacteria bacterium]